MSEPKTDKSAKTTIGNDNHDQNVGQRGDVVQSGGNKVHGDDLGGIIPHTPMTTRGSEKRRK